MTNKDELSDERLASLHQQKRINAFFTIYQRYRNYGYVIIYRTLEKSHFVNALKDERDAILYDAIMESLDAFDKERGTFRKLFSTVVEHQTINYVREFKKDPLSDYISIDTVFNENSDFRYADSLLLADKDMTPQDRLNINDNTKRVNANYDGIYRRKIKKMIKLKEQGFSNLEIAKRFKTSEGAVRSVFYRIRKRIAGKNSNKIKK
ncbi:MAG: hypothetical protein MJ208_03830 [Bacilli bacterium]|nr:hypothetical protein [Bacilli bacterium]